MCEIGLEIGRGECEVQKVLLGKEIDVEFPGEERKRRVKFNPETLFRDA